MIPETKRKWSPTFNTKYKFTKPVCPEWSLVLFWMDRDSGKRQKLVKKVEILDQELAPNHFLIYEDQKPFNKWLVWAGILRCMHPASNRTFLSSDEILFKKNRKNFISMR